MSSKAQINANRQNAQKSTGPKSDEGKAAVSQNAVKHGLFAESVIKGENPADYEVFHTKMLAELAPVGLVEAVLADRIASLWWRLKRAERMQNQAIDVMIARDEPSPLSKRLHNCLPKDLQEIDYDTRAAGPELVLGRAIIKDYSYSRVLDRMILYERRIENSLNKASRELERRQMIRQVEQQYAEQEQAIPSTLLRTGHFPIKDNREVAATQSTTAVKIDDLKKQSQFVPGLNGATSYMKGDYDNNSPAGSEENKAKQTQIQAPALTEGAENTGKSHVVANSIAR